MLLLGTYQIYMELPIQVSPEAWAKIRAIRTQKQIPATYALRLGMRGSGCSGQFFLGFDTAQPDDAIFTLPEENIIIKKAQLLYFYAVSLDWVENGTVSGLKFTTRETTL